MIVDNRRLIDDWIVLRTRRHGEQSGRIRYVYWYETSTLMWVELDNGEWVKVVTDHYFESDDQGKE